MTMKNKAFIGLALLLILVMVSMTISIIFVPGTKSEIMSFIGQKTDFSQNSPNLWRYEDMKPDDHKKAIATLPVAWVTVSPLGWHGEAMAFGATSVIDQTICEKAWEKVGGVLIPPLNIGTDTNYIGWNNTTGQFDQWGMEAYTKEHCTGTIFLKSATFEHVIRDYLHFLEREGFELCVFVSSFESKEHVKVINDLCDSVNAAYEKKKGKIRAYLNPNNDSKLVANEDLSFKGSGSYADFAEASRLGAINPSLVDKSKFGTAPRDQAIKIQQSNASKIDFEKGSKSVAFLAEQLADGVVKKLAEIGWSID